MSKMTELTRITDEEIKLAYGEGVGFKVPEWDIWAYGYSKAAQMVADAQLAHSQKEIEATLRAIGEWLDDFLLRLQTVDEGYEHKNLFDELSNIQENFRAGIKSLKQGRLPEGMGK